MVVEPLTHFEHWPTGIALDRTEAHDDRLGAPLAAVTSVTPPGGELKLLSVIAHELRAPLVSLTTSSALLLEDFDVVEREQLRRMIATIHRGSLWLQNLVDNLLNAAAISSGRLRLKREAVDLADVVMEITPVVEPILTQKEQSLYLATSAGDGLVYADPRRIGQVLVNLILNASKYAGPGTPIDLAITPRARHVRLTVADQGPGIPPGTEDHLFEPFYQASRVDGSPEGVGLGLAIVKWLVEAHGGRVGGANRSEGGACFWFELPAYGATCPALSDGTILGGEQ